MPFLGWKMGKKKICYFNNTSYKDIYQEKYGLKESKLSYVWFYHVFNMEVAIWIIRSGSDGG